MYNQRDVTSDLLPLVASVDYVDKVNAESDTISIVVSDPDARFFGSWYPEKGDTIDLSIGYDDNLVPCGLFEIDQVEASGPPLSVSLMGIAAPVSKALRTRRSFAHEDSSLQKIAQEVAQKNGLVLSGNIDPNIYIRRSTQNRETDLRFLTRLANAHGHGFNVRGNALVFYSFYDLEALQPKLTIDLGELNAYRFKDKTAQVYKSARLVYHNPDDQKLVSYEDNDGKDTEDELLLYDTAKSGAEAASKARAALHVQNTQKTTASITLIGNPAILAGNNIQLTGAGVFNGLYHVESSRHNISAQGGYTTSADLKKVG